VHVGRGGDGGQTVILYGAVMAGLLFLAFAFFAVAQAGTVRNGGQSAADAAAIAAAQDDRDQLFDGFLDGLGDGGSWRDWLLGDVGVQPRGCAAADDFAGRNQADVTSCEAVTRDGDDGYTVRVETRFDTGRTLIPSASHRKARAGATAVIRPRCDIGDRSGGEENDGGYDGGGKDGGKDGGGKDGGKDGGGKDEPDIQLICDGDDFVIDPGEDTDGLGLKPSDLFSVVLVG
jgi:hypothetical protein